MKGNSSRVQRRVMLKGVDMDKSKRKQTQPRCVFILATRKTILDTLAALLRDVGYEVVAERNRRRLVRQARYMSPDVLLVDLAHTNTEMLETCHAIQRRIRVPLVLIGSESDIPQMDSFREAFHVADEVIRPFENERLLDAIEKAFDETRWLEIGDVRLDRRLAVLETPRGAFHLRPKEFLLLELLMRHPGRLFTLGELAHRVWEWDEDYVNIDPDDEDPALRKKKYGTLYVHIRWLRKKLEANPNRPRYLHTVRGKGYVFEDRGAM